MTIESKVIFLVDDEESNLKLMERILKRDFGDYQICKYQKPTEAVEELPIKRPEVVVCDYNMKSSLNGRDVLKKVKEYLPEIKTMLCASCEPSEVEELERLGVMDFYMPKPIQGYSIADWLKRLLGK